MLLNKNTASSLKKVMFSVVGVLLISILLIFVNVNSKEITISNGEDKINFEFKGQRTVSEILAENDIELKEEDKVSPSLDTVLADGDQIVIKKAVSVAVVVDNKKYEFLTCERDIGKILNEIDIRISELDIIKPDLNSSIDENNSEIQIIRVKEEFEINQTPIKYNNIVEKDSKMDIGESTIAQRGSNGTKEIKEKIIYHNGEEFDRKVVDEKIKKEPVDEIQKVGTNNLVATSRGNRKFTNKINVVATGYCSCSKCTASYGGSKTASGSTPQQGRTIASSRKFSFGTNMYIPELGKTYTVEDRGGAITGNRIDIYFNSHSEAVKFGRRTFQAYVLQ